MWVVDCWRVVMDARFNPLKHIPDPSLQMYFTLVLFVMWSVYFGFVASYYMGWLGYDIVVSIIVHMAVIIPVGFTNAIFMDAERENAPWLYKWKLNRDLDQQDINLKKSNYEKRIKWDIDREA
jgi:hypothetical protein